MRALSLLPLLLVGSCASLEESPLRRQIAASVQPLAHDVRRLLAPDGLARFALLDRRPMFLDFRNAVRRLPATLRLDEPPLADRHTAVRAMASGSGSWQAPGLLTRALSRLLP
ncbi:MAG: hypothetical protein R3F56_15050 [Planctomycetota bacterium]